MEQTEKKKEVSRQRRWQLKKLAQGLCQKCGKPQGRRRGYCDEHYVKYCKYVGIRRPFLYCTKGR